MSEAIIGNTASSMTMMTMAAMATRRRRRRRLTKYYGKTSNTYFPFNASIRYRSQLHLEINNLYKR
jgi:hypothetical protein